MAEQDDSSLARRPAGRSRKTVIVTCVAVALIAISAFVAYQATHRYRARTAEIYHKLTDRFRHMGAAMRQSNPLEGPVTSVFALFDAIDLYQKNGLIEVYGAELRQRKNGPIRVSQSIVQAEDDRAYVFWSPDYSPALGATHLEVRLHDAAAPGQLKIGIISSSGMTYLFEAELGANMPPPNPKPLPPLVPEGFTNVLSKPAARTPLTRRADGALSAALPIELQAEINSPGKGEKAVATFLLIIDNAAGASIAFDRIALVKATGNTKPSTISLGGMVTGAMILPGAIISLLTDKGEQVEQQLSLDNTFRFEGIQADQPVSLRFRHNKRDYYSNLGRWLSNDGDRNDLRVDLAPLYTNPDGHPADATKAKFVTPRVPSTVAAIYEPHARQVWPGNTTPQEYDSITFTNNMGFLDRDRFFDNPDNCLRIVHLGSSHAVALQVRPFEKYNIVMEQELGVRLQRCVEVISAGRDNGDVGSNYPRVRDYAVKFKPDAILFENGSTLVMQLHPKLLKLGFGWDHENNALDNFFYDKQGVLQFRPAVADYGVYATKPDFSELTKGVPLYSTLKIPFARMHPWGKEAFRYLADIMAYMKSHHPDQRLILHTALDEAQCRDRCNTKVTLPGGKVVSMGAATYVANHKEFCLAHGLDCIYPKDTTGYGTPDTYLNFVNDGHYSVRGHQWLARELASSLLELHEMHQN
jgi:hypothetical protein